MSKTEALDIGLPLRPGGGFGRISRSNRSGQVPRPRGQCAGTADDPNGQLRPNDLEKGPSRSPRDGPAESRSPTESSRPRAPMPGACRPRIRTDRTIEEVRSSFRGRPGQEHVDLGPRADTSAGWSLRAPRTKRHWD